MPASISLYADPEIEDRAVIDFLQIAADFLLDELIRRERRGKRIVEMRLFRDDELEAFFTERTQAQPWAIYYSKDGGLGISSDARSDLDAERGVIPCSTMQNHGVAWRRGAESFDVWLATARKPGGDWDFDSDIGHESAHAAFAPIPLFSQALFEVDGLAPLRAVETSHNLSAPHMALLVYFFTEIAVCAVRGESRNTQTGLPVADAADLSALLRLSCTLFPDDGFRSGLRALERARYPLDVESGSEIYEIAAPIMRVIPRLAPLIREAQASVLIPEVLRDRKLRAR
ncbi:MAG TPA: hypothetical protein VKV74_04270 [Bryobacteraceae bacterium]|nr:hypothetical protein [Bryobacteraceae bacterium]